MNELTPTSITLCVHNSKADKYGVTWHTNKYGSPILEYTAFDDIEFNNRIRITGNCSEGMETVKNTAVFKNVTAGAKYRFRVGDTSGIFSDIFVCRFPSHHPNELTFLLITDTQDEANNGTWLKFAYLDAKESYPDAELLIHTGDMVQESGKEILWSMMLENNREFFLSMPMVYVSGNHDYWEGYLHGHRHTAEKHFHVDHPIQDTSHGVYYSFDVGPAHFTVLSSGDSMETNNNGLLREQYDWAIQDLSETDKKWKVVCIHNPFYSPGKYGCRPPLNKMANALRAQLNKDFAHLGVDIVLCGHDHVYSQTYPINAKGEPVKDYEFIVTESGTKVTISPCGPIHFESGCAGNQDRGIEDCLCGDELEKYEKISPMTYGTVAYSAIKINDDILTVCYKKISVNTGECLEENKFGIKKSLN